ncbi:hypothetical protein JW949_01560 [Candidatus Woesearchaeota archaeon]|nr:hypothetical protein [Candidatus Woesearchaeota archaeon]
MKSDKNKRKKKRKPVFIRQASKRKSRLSSTWRKPKGLQSKLRRKLRGHREHPKTGYKNPKTMRNLSPEGLEIVYVTNISSIDHINPEKQAVIISAALGKKKKMIIVEKAKKNKIKILNFNTEEFDKKIMEWKKTKEQKKKEIETRRKKKEREQKEKKKQPEKEKKDEMSETKVSEHIQKSSIPNKTKEEEKEQAKKEKDKLLTKKK